VVAEQGSFFATEAFRYVLAFFFRKNDAFAFEDDVILG